MEQLIVEYPRGRMIINVDQFFPCKLEVARKAFPFFNQWISEDTFNELWDVLSEKYEWYCYLAQDAKALADRAEVNHDIDRQKYYNARFKEYEALRKRCRRNIELLIGGYRL